jgi:uncharacterized protein YgbK (DUF1537 family)
MIGFYGDDFTGSVDALLQLRLAGLIGELFTDPASVAGVEAEVVGIAGTSRALATADMEAEVRPALEALRAAGCDLVLYKACSTADSSPTIGSIGRAIEIGRSVFGDRAVPVLLAQPDFGRWTVFGTHFAREGDHVYRLDRQPTMSRHPSTPIHEADLRLHLGAQTGLPVSGIDHRAYGVGPDVLAEQIGRLGGVVVLDGVTDGDLTLVGRAVVQLPRPVFMVGSGGLALGVGRAAGGTAPALPRVAEPAAAPVLVVSGSCSQLSWRQVQAAIDAGWTGIDALDDSAPSEAAAAAAAGQHVVAYTAAGTAGASTAHAAASRLATVVAAVTAYGRPGRVVIAGGDTSGELLRLLGATSLSIVAAPWGNLPLLRVRGGVVDGAEVVLKGGQVGAVDAYLAIADGRSA